MHSARITDRISDEAMSELERATREDDAVTLDVTDEDAVTLHGETRGFERLRKTLWIRELTAREHGQDGLAVAGRTARVALQQAETGSSTPPPVDTPVHGTSLSD